MTPPGIESSRLLCLLDLSWWLSRAWYVALREALGGADPATATDRQHRIAATKTIALVTGWLARLLSAPTPACVAVALDSMGPTWRHRRTETLPEERRYKAGRGCRPEAYHRASNTVIEIVQLHAIPILSAEGFEADDCIAAGVAQAVETGLDVAIISADKDLASLVRARGTRPLVVQWPWSGHEGIDEVRNWGDIEKKYGVPPDEIADWLAIVGDASDNVRGVEGVGEEGAAEILRAIRHPLFVATTPHLSPLERALGFAVQAPYDAALATAQRAVRLLKDRPPNALSSDETKAHHAQKLAEAEAIKEQMKAQRRLARDLDRLHASRESVVLARELVTLDASCPIVWRPEELPVGGYDVEGLRALYRDLDFHKLACEVAGQPKRSIQEIIGGP